MRGRMGGSKTSGRETMKAISAAIIALTGAVTIAGGGVWGSDTGNFTLLVGYGLLIIGAVTWVFTVVLEGHDK